MRKNATPALLAWLVPLRSTSAGANRTLLLGLDSPRHPLAELLTVLAGGVI